MEPSYGHSNIWYSRPIVVELAPISKARPPYSDSYTLYVVIGDRFRALREEKKFSQGNIEKKTGLLCCYISRVEHGHTVPAIETLEKFARALEVPMYQLFYEGEEPPKLPNLPKRKTTDDILWGSKGKNVRMLA